MFNRRNKARWRALVAVACAAVFTAGCTGLPLEATWADVSLYGTPPQIMFVYANEVRQVDPVDGSASELRDSNGEVRFDDAGVARPWALPIPTGSGTVTFYTRPLPVEDDIAVIAAYENKLFEIDPITARVISNEGHPLPGHVVATPLLSENTLYVPLSETRLVALDAQTFDTLWTHPTERGVWATPLLLDGVLYVPSMDHILYALNAESGEVIWRLDLEGAIAATPIYANGHLYVASFGRKLYKITTDGQIVASFQTNDWVWGAPAVIDDTIYLSDLGGYVYALRDEGDSFSAIWSRQVATRGIRATPLVTEDTVVVGARDNFVYWLSRETGEEQVKRELRGPVLSDLLLIQPEQIEGVDEPFVVVSTLAREELLVAFTLDDGERKWVFP